ncbi:hypothetical protein M9H77_26112 [Catharanthus roseus]|uniref:Uncharacterized protein n=1 Tax=Catharanthus roseus TaxID=4058 RepID=A0ACC0A9L9_CATRO|nr:hypothetical protein M9H77_26112 [Catharanthus roseus]
MDSFENYLHNTINFKGRKKKARLDDDDENVEEKLLVKCRGPYGIKKYEEEEDRGTQHDRISTSSRHNMSLFETIGMAPKGKTFIVEKDNDKSNPVIAQLCYNVNHLALKIIKDKIKRASKILTDLENLYGNWFRTSRMLPCSCELLKQYQMYITLKLEDVHIFWRSLEISGLLGIGRQQSSQVMELRRGTQIILHHVITFNPKGPILGAPPMVFTKGRHKTNSTKRDKSYWEHT